MYDMMKRLAIALTMMAMIGLLIFGGKASHAEEHSKQLSPMEEGNAADRVVLETLKKAGFGLPPYGITIVLPDNVPGSHQ